MGALKRIEEVIREKASELKKKKPVLKFKIRLALIKFRTTGSRCPSLGENLRAKKGGKEKTGEAALRLQSLTFPVHLCEKKKVEVPEEEAGPVS